MVREHGPSGVLLAVHADRDHRGAFLRKQYSAMAGMFDRSCITSTPSGDIEPVEMLSPRTIRTLPDRDSGRSGGMGGGWMFRPLSTCTFAASSRGGGWINM